MDGRGIDMLCFAGAWWSVCPACVDQLQLERLLREGGEKAGGWLAGWLDLKRKVIGWRGREGGLVVLRLPGSLLCGGCMGWSCEGS